MKKIIYLEDDPSVAEVVNALLPYAGFEARYEKCAKNLCDQILNAKFEPGSLYLLDHENFTDTNPQEISGGYVALEIMRVDPHAKIVIGTGKALNDLPFDVQNAVDKGQIGYMQKPFGLKELRRLYD